MTQNLTKILFLLVLLSGAAFAEDNRFILIESQIQSIDMARPWNYQNATLKHQIGTYIGSGRFVTTFETVRYAKSISGQKFGEFLRVPLKTVAVDEELNLALLEVDSDEVEVAKVSAWLGTLKQVAIGPELPPSTSLKIFRIGQNRTIKNVSQRIIDIVTTTIGYGETVSPLYSFDATGLGGKATAQPIMKDGKLAGIMSWGNTRLLYGIPSTIVSDFVARARDGDYEGIVRAQVTVKISINKFERKLLKVPESIQHGIFVNSVSPKSPFYNSLKKNDLILEVDGKRLSYKGDISHRKWNKVPVSYLLLRKKVGSRIFFKIIRDGKEENLNVKIEKKYDTEKMIVPTYFRKPRDHYMIVGGLVLMELSRDYMQIWGNNWKSRAPVDLVEVALTSDNEENHKNAVQKVVVLTDVLASDINKGYEGSKNYILEKVNDQPVKSLEQMIEILQQSPMQRGDRSFATFDFKFEGLRLVLDYDKMSASKDPIFKKYGLPKNANYFSIN